ncbi:hypothetical protein ACWGB8_02600 [Kitasatospora sp. NPDC054939]
MYVIRVHLSAPNSDLPAPPAAALREGLEQRLRRPTRVCHARFRETPGRLDGVLFVMAVGLLPAEAELAAALRELLAGGGPWGGWQLVRCEADAWLALGLHELPSRP